MDYIQFLEMSNVRLRDIGVGPPVFVSFVFDSRLAWLWPLIFWATSGVIGSISGSGWISVTRTD